MTPKKILIAVLICFLAINTLAAQTVKTITFAYEDINNPPHALGDGTRIDWNKPGTSLELFKRVAERLGITIKFRRMPWKRGMYLLEKNEIDGLFHASFKDARKKIGVYPQKNGSIDESKAIFQQTYSLYTLSGSTVRVNNGKISGLTGDIAAFTNYSIVNDLRQQGYSVKESPSQQRNFEKLLLGKTAAYAMLENMADDYLKRNQHEFHQIVKAPCQHIA